ncbi:MAG: deoxyribodipyrimidine photo-lyase [Methylophilaceae bacterium]
MVTHAKNLPDKCIFEPYLMPKSQHLQYGCILDKEYPTPLVDIAKATREARLNITLGRKKDDAYEKTQAVINKNYFNH